ncbi:MAG TPA: hypothetical protein VLJ68_00520, partial [Chitinophagaceae bacterium]|nr:hypothetical protein [Chitinophagaceae bacterium]
MKILILTLLMLASLAVHAQLLKKLKEKTVDKAVNNANAAKNNSIQKVKDEPRNLMHKQMQDLRGEFDSTDVDYA